MTTVSPYWYIRGHALGLTQTFVYDAASQLVSMTDQAARTTSFQYDALGRTVLVTDALGQTTATAYDDVGNVISTTDALSQVTRLGYDPLNRQTAIIDPRGGVTSFTFDAVGNRTSLTDPVGNTTSWVFDGLNRAIEETNELGFTRFFSFGAIGSNTRIIDRNGRIREFDYDPLYRMTAERWLVPDPSLPTGYSVLRTIASTYDAASQMTSISDADYTGAFTYDALGRVLTIDNLGTPNLPHTILTHTWDPAGNRTSLAAAIDGFGSVVNNYQYDALNRTTRIEQSGTGVTEKRVDLAYNGLGQFTQIDRYRDLGGTQLVASSTYGYDALARLTSLLHSRPSALDPQLSTPIASYSWSYDSLSRITAMTTPDGAGNYSYDPTSQLVAEDYDNFQPDQTHTWDLNGNPVGSGFVVGSNNQLLETPTHEYQYDGEGNRIREIDKATGRVRHYEWDHRNRLVEVRDQVGGAGVSPVTTQIANYRYSPLTNYRIGKRVVSLAAGAVDSVFAEGYVHDGAEILFATDDNEIVTDLYLDGQMLMDMHLANEKFNPAGVSQQTYWSLWDHQWSVRDVVDNAGTPVDHLIYDSFGIIINQTAPNLGLRFKYTGREQDRETGLYYYRARYYDAPARRFVSGDPTGFGGEDLNIQRYVKNSPIDAADPTGTIKFVPILKLSSDLKCGDTAKASWDILLDQEAPCDGYIVQQVDVRCTVDPCISCPTSSPTAPDFTYWEAWPVAKNSQSPGPLPGATAHDTAKHPATDNWCGNYSQVTEVRFYCKYKKDAPVGTGTTGDLGGIATSSVVSAFQGWSPFQVHGQHKGPLCATGTLGLPSYPTKNKAQAGPPPFWKAKAVEGAASRNFGVFYNCCPSCPEKKFVDADANP